MKPTLGLIAICDALFPRRRPASFDEPPPAPAEGLEPINCPTCNHRFLADTAHGDPGEKCCDVCARFTCPVCRFIFFRPYPEHAHQPPEFFRAHRAAHADH